MKFDLNGKFTKVFLIFALIDACLLCGNETSQPTNVTECTDQSDSSNYCCMLSSPGYDPLQTKCVSMSKQEYTGQYLYVQDNVYWRLNCGDLPITMEAGLNCGNPNPVQPTDCWLTSSDDSSCCYYLSNNLTGTPGCMWLGEKNFGNITQNTPKNILLTCSGHTLIVYFYLILTLSFLIIF